MNRASDVLTAGAWANGASQGAIETLQGVRRLDDQGFYLMPEQQALIELANKLDGYDNLVEELLTGENPGPAVDKRAKKAA